MTNDKNKVATALYVSLNDSSNPTYAALDGCSLVLGEPECENPCKEDNIIDKAPLVPQNHEEMKKFCDLMGYDYEHDNEGQLIIYTGMYSSDDDHYAGYTRVD